MRHFLYFASQTVLIVLTYLVFALALLLAIPVLWLWTIWERREHAHTWREMGSDILQCEHCQEWLLTDGPGAA